MERARPFGSPHKSGIGGKSLKYGVHRLTWGKAFDPDNLKLFFAQVKATGASTVEFRPPDEALNGNAQKTAGD